MPVDWAPGERAPNPAVPGETTPHYTQPTAGSEDSMPYASQGTTLFARATGRTEQSRSHGQLRHLRGAVPADGVGYPGQPDRQRDPDHAPRGPRATTTRRPCRRMAAKWPSSDAMPARPHVPSMCKAPLSAERRRVSRHRCRSCSPIQSAERPAGPRSTPLTTRRSSTKAPTATSTWSVSRRRSPSATSLPSPASAAARSMSTRIGTPPGPGSSSTGRTPFRTQSDRGARDRL